MPTIEGVVPKVLSSWQKDLVSSLRRELAADASIKIRQAEQLFGRFPPDSDDK